MKNPKLLEEKISKLKKQDMLKNPWKYTKEDIKNIFLKSRKKA